MNDQLFRKVLGYLESESYMMAYKVLHRIADEYMPLETRMDYDALHSSLSIIVGERSGYPEIAEELADSAKVYERLAWLLTKKLLGDTEAGEQADTLMLCVAAFGMHQRN
ncbi:hypothetical protein EST62_02765 [Chlorobaculum sp. 24CR]|uniref:hypothetical protein n=1 Tax=Chlorobaculum sp. 24CR TaxID=2508878 RepID=UPI00100B4DD1|nr:hypothetical protein [Chlorobaculum sp. 24CR]RXK88449.1 hypothetical protein EST62_02765 [Chlorobaculum sp. 24CR]